MSATAKALLLDFGGTLDGDGIHWSDRFAAAYLDAGIEVERDRFDRAFAATDRRIAARDDMREFTLRELLALQVELQMEALGMDPAPAGKIAEALHRETRATLARNVAILARLAGDYRLAIVSNFSGNLATVCRECGLLPLVEVLLDSRVEGLAKPDPAFFALALARLGRPAAACTFVGDSFDRDILPARALGMRTVWLAADPARPCPEPDKVDHRIRSLVELPARLGTARV